MSAGRFEVTRAFYLNKDRVARVGEVLTLDDGPFIVELFLSNKIRAADAKTEKRLKLYPVEWRPAQLSAMQPARSGFVSDW